MSASFYIVNNSTLRVADIYEAKTASGTPVIAQHKNPSPETLNQQVCPAPCFLPQYSRWWLIFGSGKWISKAGTSFQERPLSPFALWSPNTTRSLRYIPLNSCYSPMVAESNFASSLTG